MLAECSDEPLEGAVPLPATDGFDRRTVLRQGTKGLDDASSDIITGRGGRIVVKKATNQARALLLWACTHPGQNLVTGVTVGFTKTLEITASLSRRGQGQDLVLQLATATRQHPVQEARVKTRTRPRSRFRIDRRVGQLAARSAMRKPDPTM